MIYLFIKEYNSKQWTTEVACKVPKVPRSIYYHWFKDPEGQRKRKYIELDEKIREAYLHAKVYNGSSRLAKNLQTSGISVSRTTVACHVKEMSLRSKLSRRFKVTTDVSHNYKVVPRSTESWYDHKRRFSALENLIIDKF